MRAARAGPMRETTNRASSSPPSVAPASQRRPPNPSGRGITIVAIATTTNVTSPSTTFQAPTLPAIRSPPPAAAAGWRRMAAYRTTWPSWAGSSSQAPWPSQWALRTWRRWMPRMPPARSPTPQTSPEAICPRA